MKKESLSLRFDIETRAAINKIDEKNGMRNKKKEVKEEEAAE